MTPQIELPKDNDEIEKVLEGQADLAFDMSFEVLPEIQITDFAGLTLTRMTADVEDAAIDEAVEMIDVGGLSLLGAAARNFGGVAAISDPADYAALVEESAAAAESLNDQATRLSSLVGNFRVRAA